ncbi:MAG TPA: PPC domain-containing protein, partial [Polyangia bacterium]
MRFHSCVLALLIVGLAAAGCTSPGTDNGCDGITCGGHGTCRVVGGSAGCTCDSGYSPSGHDCIASAGCDPNPCTKLGQTRCELQNHLPVCLCDAGYHDTTDGCVPDAGGPCDPNPCTEAHRTQCVVQSGAAKCRCDVGYNETAGGACVSSDPCFPNPCGEPHKSVCSSQSGSAVCGCDFGYTANAQGDCILSATGCSPNPCTDAHKTVCTEVSGVPFCSCDAGYRADGAGGCVFEASCTPNPCTGTHKTTCSVVNNATHCSCDVGWVDDGSGACVADTSGCGSQHTTGDTYEPDECGPLAKDLVVGTPQTHTIEPAGDNDWFKATLLTGHSYHFEVTGLDAYIYMYQSDAVTVIESNDYPQSIDYSPTADGTFYFRVRHYYSTDTGTYTVSLSDFGTDVGNTAATATAATVGTPVVSQLSPAGDEDWFSFTAAAGHVYSANTTGADTWVYFYATDGTTILDDADYPPIYMTAASAGTYYVRVKHYSSSGTGSYTLTITDLGADDHGNDAASATAVTLGTAVTGTIMPAGDNDWFKWTAAAGHIYKVNTTGVDTYVYVYDTDGTTVLKENDL